MKKQLLLLALGLFVAKTTSFSQQELVVDGNMETELSWELFMDGGAPDSTVVVGTFNYTPDIPTGGSGGCLEVTGYGQTSAFFYQKVTIVPGHKYLFDGLVKSIAADPLTSSWVELNLTKVKPVRNAKNDSAWYNYSKNSWMAAPYNDFSNIDGDFMSTSQLLWKKGKPKSDGTGYEDSVLTSKEFTIPATETVTEWYVVIKVGCWNTLADPNPTFDYLFDNISLKDLDFSSIAETNAGNIMSIFPNPSTGLINIKSNENLDVVNYDIYNVSGALVESGNLDNNQNLDLTSFVKGVYFIKLDNKSSIEFHKLILE
jgi:hypothetical protein